MGLYSTLVRPLAFRLDPERVHRLALSTGAAFGWAGGAARALTTHDDARLHISIAGLDFPNPIGLAAGFDKSGTALRMLAGLGFGALEIGSVSVDPSLGNPKPRLFRLPEDKAIVVAYGLPNDGADVIARRISRLD